MKGQKCKNMNLLATGAYAFTDTELEQIRQMGHNVLFMRNEKGDLPCEVSHIEGIIGNEIFLHHDIASFSNLRYIQLTSAGYDRVPMDYVAAHNIEIHNARGVYSIPMAEFCLCGVLQLYKQSRFFMKNQRDKTWEKHRSLLELCGKTVCIVGCGSVGNTCADRFAAFGCRVLGVDVVVKEEKQTAYTQMYTLSALDTVLSESDVVVLSLPLTAETKQLFDAARLSHIKKGAILVNLSRGALVETAALITALHGRLGGAVLDVFEEEPLDAKSPLWDMENVIVTPHNSFVGDGNRERLWSVIIGNLKQCK